MDTDQAIKRIKRSREYRLDPDNREYISEIERDLEQLKTDAAFQKLDQVKIIRSRIKSIIVSARLRLVEEDDAQKRLQMKADLNAYKWLLRFFSRNVDKEMEEINEKLNDKLSEL